MKYDYPKIENKRDLIVFFAEYFENKFGYQLPSSDWGKTAGFINNMEKQGYSLKDITLVVWGKINTCDKVKSIWYCKYDFDKIPLYKKALKKHNNSKKNKEEFVDIYDKDNQEEGDFFAEFYE